MLIRDYVKKPSSLSHLTHPYLNTNYSSPCEIPRYYLQPCKIPSCKDKELLQTPEAQGKHIRDDSNQCPNPYTNYVGNKNT